MRASWPQVRGCGFVKLSYYREDDVLAVYIEDVGKDHFEDRGNVTILYRNGRPIGFEVWHASKLLVAAKSVGSAGRRLARSKRRL